MTKSVAFHSYKGGTGKTTIASNIAALLTVKGYKVALLDLDVYAPSLLSYFDKQPRKWLNDYLLGDAEIDDAMMPVTDIVASYRKDRADTGVNGKLWVGFCSAKKDDVYKIEAGTAENTKSQLRRFILLRQNLIRDYEIDFIIIDTSPGIRYWSMNALAVADTLLLTLKLGDIDIEGTAKLASEIYGSLTKYGTKSFLVLNRVAGYCVPGNHSHASNVHDGENSTESYSGNPGPAISKQTNMDVIAAIPCYCDIQFSKKEFLTALRYPDHPFTKQLQDLAESISSKS